MFARSLARPPSRVELYKAALERMTCSCMMDKNGERHHSGCTLKIARAALEAGEKLEARDE